MFSAVVRRDGSSRFGTDNKFATFPSFSAGWNISNESFFQAIDVISLLKLRASWGQNGSEFFSENYPFQSIVGSGRGYTYIDANGQEVFVGGAAPSRPANPKLKWETSEQTDFGLDVSLLQNKINITADYYIKKTKGLIVAAPIAAYLGSPSSPAVNGGSVENRGIELALDYNDQIGDFKYTLGFNVSHNKNKVTEIANAEKRILGPSFVIGSPSRTEVGQPIASFYGYKTNGIFQNEAEIAAHSKGDKKIQPLAVPGDVRFIDLNDDGVIDDNDRTFIGNPTPDYSFGINLKGEYKGFDLSLFFNGVYGNEIFNGTRRHDLYASNMPAKFLNRWTGEGSTNTMPRFTSNDVNGNWSKISDLYLEDGSYLRLRNIQLGYNVPASVLKLSKIEKLRIYVSGDNILTFTKYTGFDPEVGARSNNGNLNPLDLGIDRGVYPQAKSYRVGLSVTF
jgi:TonB-linked SusC/RagA family outer membrane protein